MTFLGLVSLGTGGGGYLGEVGVVGGIVPTSIAIGTPVTGGGANRVLFEGATQLLAADADFTYLATTDTLSVPNLAVTANAVGTAPLQVNHVANATSPVEIIKGGATPTATGDLAQWQLSTGVVSMRLSGGGNLLEMGINNNSAELKVGPTAQSGVATPSVLDLGGTFSNTAGAGLKLEVFNDGVSLAGIGASGGQQDYRIYSGGAHVWYEVTTETLRLSSTVGLRSQHVIQEKQGTTIASADPLPLTATGNYFVVTGNNNINHLSTVDRQDGCTIELHFTGNLTIFDDTAAPPANTAPFILNGGLDIATATTNVVLLRLGTVAGKRAWRQTAPATLIAS